MRTKGGLSHEWPRANMPKGPHTCVAFARWLWLSHEWFVAFARWFVAVAFARYNSCESDLIVRRRILSVCYEHDDENVSPLSPKGALNFAMKTTAIRGVASAD